MVDIRPQDLNPAVTPIDADSPIIIDQGLAGVNRTTSNEMVNSVAPVASQSEAEVGADDVKRMTALKTKQSIASEVGVSLASFGQGVKADSAVQPLDPSLVPTGGLTGQVLVKATNTAFDTEWKSVAAATAVSYGPQTLTEAQKVQARQNIQADHAYDTIAIATAATVPSFANAIRTNGYYAAGDGGAALYKRVASEPVHAGKVQSADGAWWEISVTEYNPQQFGNMGTANDSATVERCILAVSALGGGVIRWPAGTFKFLDAPILTGVRHIGAGWESTILTVPAGTTAGSIFRCKGAREINSSDWSYLTLDGGSTGISGVDWSDMTTDFLAATPSRDFTADKQRWFGDPSGVIGIDMRECTKWEEGTSIGLFINNCWRGISGSQNDRKPHFIACRFWNNFAGTYNHNNHMHFSMCDFRNNNMGLQSRGGYDMQFTHCTFVTNWFGILPDPLHTNGGSFQQVHLTNCFLFNNVCGGAVVNARVQFNNCLLIHGTLGRSDSFGIRFKGRGSAFNGGGVRGEGTQGFGDCAFIVDKSPGDIICDVQIANVTVFTNNVCRIDYGASTQAAQVTIKDLSGWVRGYVLKSEKRLDASTISGNNLTIPTGSILGASDAFFLIGEATPAGIGNVIANNTLRDQSSSPAAGFRIDARGSVITGNIINRDYVELARNDRTRLANNIFPDDLTAWRNRVFHTATINPGSIPAGGVFSTTLSISGQGVSVGRPLIAGYSENLNSLILSVEATAAAARVEIFNPTAAAVAVPAGTVTIQSV